MKNKNFKTILIGLVIALGSFHMIIFIHTLLGMLTDIKLNKPLNEYLLWGYSPMILSGLYIGFSKRTKTVLIAAFVGALFYFFSWLIADVLLPSQYFDHSFKPLSFGFGLLRNAFSCALIAWLTYLFTIRNKSDANQE